MPPTLQVTSKERNWGRRPMDMTGERRIAASRQVVWNALNDPDVLRASIPGCESLEKQSDSAMAARAAVKIGPIAARFAGKVQLSDIDAPNGYRISGEGQGGVAGFARGGANVHLDDDDGGGTLLRYEVHAQVGGKLAQLGSRLIDATARQMADQFFDRFSAQVAPAEAETAEPAMAGAAVAAGEAGHGVASVPPGTDPVFPAIATGDRAARPQSANEQVFPAAPGSEVARPVLPPARPSAPVSLFALIPREPFGLPLAAWIGGAVYLFIVVLYLGSIF